MKTCYYELLGVEHTASDSELKKAYRKKALQYHPDKNIEDSERATEIFATVRGAYEVLSDPQERAWYDSHRTQILNDDDDLNSNTNSYEHEVNSIITGITTEDLMKFFNYSLYIRLDNTPAGLYQIAGKVFAKLASDEIKFGRRLGLDKYDKYLDDSFESDINSLGYVEASDAYITSAHILFPQFGYSSTDYQTLKSFYKKWSTFNTVKPFNWKDEYMYSKNYDRKTKREINKRNDKLRLQARNDYNKTVRRFVSFIKKCDKRMKEGAKKFELDKQKGKDNLNNKIETNRSSHDINLYSSFELQSWQTVDQERFDEIDNYFEQYPYKKSTDKEVIIYECFICNKNFKSEKQLEVHTNSKIHKKLLKELQREMKMENITLGLAEVSDMDQYGSANDFFDEDNNSSESLTPELVKSEYTVNNGLLNSIENIKLESKHNVSSSILSENLSKSRFDYEPEDNFN